MKIPKLSAKQKAKARIDGAAESFLKKADMIAPPVKKAPKKGKKGGKC